MVDEEAGWDQATTRAFLLSLVFSLIVGDLIKVIALTFISGLVVALRMRETLASGTHGKDLEQGPGAPGAADSGAAAVDGAA